MIEGWIAQWLTAAATQAQLPPASRVDVEQCTVIHWPDHYTAVALPDTPREVQAAWEDRGYTFVRFAGDVTAWGGAFQRLSRLLGA